MPEKRLSAVQSAGSNLEAVGGIPLGRIVAHHAARDADRPALTIDGATWTRSELEARANRRARALTALGVGAGDFVTVMLPNCHEHFETTYALWKLGATPNIVSWRLPDNELRAIIELVRPKLVVGCDPARLPGFKTLASDFEPDPALSADPLPERVSAYWKAMTSGGSTGRPKVIVDHMPGRWNPEISVGHLAIDGAMLMPAPLYHNAPFMMTHFALFIGNHVVQMTKFDALQTLQLIERYRVDWLYLVPTMMHRIWRLPRVQRESFDLSSLNTVIHMGATCPIWLKEAWIGWLGADKIFEGYGGTERQASTEITGREWLLHKGSVGKVNPGAKIRILDERHNECAVGQIGEIFFLPEAGRNATYHYIGAEARAAGEWESIGDLGYIDADGYLYLADRRTDLVISGGANIYPAEVEAAIDAHPDVGSSVAVGLPDEDLGQRLHAIVEIKPAARSRTGEAELRAHLEAQIARYKIPRSFEFVDAPLRDDAGKVRRVALREERIVRMATDAQSVKQSVKSSS